VIALRYPWRWQLAGFLLLVFVMIAALVPKLPFHELALQFRISDKVMHIAAFAFLAVWFSGQYEKRSYWRIALGLIAFGILIELVQSMVSYRTAEWMDLIGDAAGITIGLLIGVLGAGGWSMRVEERLGT
jgi:VanZ family protein